MDQKDLVHINVMMDHVQKVELQKLEQSKGRTIKR